MAQKQMQIVSSIERWQHYNRYGKAPKYLKYCSLEYAIYATINTTTNTIITTTSISIIITTVC